MKTLVGSDISKYPLLNKNENVTSLSQELVIINTAKLNKEKELDLAVKSVQKDCQHDWEKQTKYDKYAPSAFKGGGHIGQGVDVMLSRTCRSCGLTETKPEGSETKVCSVCWFPMQYHSTIPGQGERTQVYECTNPKCNHAAWHT
jgi:hypothetical protein